MMGERQVHQDALFYEFSLQRHVLERHPLRLIDRFVELDGLRRELVSFLQRHRPAFERPGTDDPHADRGLLLWHRLGTAVMRRGAPEPRLPVVLPAGARWRDA